ncbi:hypothetical protein L5G28_09680 [Gordonia sp. HY285]|uniref:hypothetical protein n=1 Tax=Gordonia liuliyuniae TaxID=2911517 RepID=UPI001F3C6C20|nr:hypothetical protein [Gordonia liuliyuniae]MCF8610424.1 hypothetical protein [Gordonia liuliyuniae]
MLHIACDQCGTVVLTEKYSPRHTSVQWLGHAREQCPHSAEAGTSGCSTNRKRLCPALHATIDAAARDGALPMTRRSEPTPGVLG